MTLITLGEMSSHKSFSELSLDDRLLKAIAKLGWSTPSAVQERAIPLIMQGRDVVARAKTGSGKTAAYLLPVLQKLLARSTGSTETRHPVSLVLAPSKELCKQATRITSQLTAYCSKDISFVDLASTTVQQSATQASSADLLVSTPGKLLAHLNNKSLTLDFLTLLVIDEADMIISYGFEEDLKSLARRLPTIHQSVLVSATIGKDVDALKSLLLREPVVLKMQESDLPDEQQLTQYVVKCEQDDKYLLVYALFKLNLVRGKSLVFVNSVDASYRLKLFLEQFFITSCVINAQLPQNSRAHIIDQFNCGAYDIVIATDEAITINTSATVEDTMEGGKETTGDDTAPKQKKKPKQKKGKQKGDKEFNVSRGIDFQDVDNIVNFEFPLSVDSYVHRVGRTARGDSTGTALSLVASPNDRSMLEKVQERLLSGFVGPAPPADTLLKPYNFRMDEVEGFRYRVKDACANLSKVKVRDARLKEIRGEIVTSQKLKAHFEDNPKDLKVLMHDKALGAQGTQKPEMKHVPDYLVPEALKHVMLKAGKKRKHTFPAAPRRGKGRGRRDDDPLKTFKFKKAKQ